MTALRAAVSAVLALWLVVFAPDSAAGQGSARASPVAEEATGDTPARTGLDIYREFREGLAAPECGADVSTRWRKHFAAAPRRLASADDETLLLFGYVVDEVRKSHLPTEYALIPFVESGYRPDARSPLGPAGLWQMIKLTARDHKVPIGKGYDGRLSPIDSTRAAVRYLKTLHGMFAGDWRLAVMAYNAGEYRILGALRRGGQVARDAQPESLPGLPRITHAYVRKLHALACVLQDAGEDATWIAALERGVPSLEPVEVGPGVTRIAQWAERHDQDAERLRWLNPVHKGRIRRSGQGPAQLLAVSPVVLPVPDEAPAGGAAGSP